MPTPAVALKLKRFRRRFGITAPRVVVRTHLPWVWLALPMVLLLLLVFSLVWLFAQRNASGEMGREIEFLRARLNEQGEELAVLRAASGTGQSAVNMERAAQQHLLARMHALELENATLKEDMLLFERLIPVLGEEAVVRVEGFRVIAEGEGRYRYRLLFAFQPGRQIAEFRGHLQLVVTFLQSGKEQQMTFPARRDALPEYQLELKHFLRREGGFQLPLSAQVRGVEVRVLQGDTLKAKRLAQL